MLQASVPVQWMLTLLAQVCSMPLSVLIWTFGALAGVDHYKVDIETGTRYSREVR